MRERKSAFVTALLGYFAIAKLSLSNIRVLFRSLLNGSSENWGTRFPLLIEVFHMLLVLALLNLLFFGFGSLPNRISPMGMIFIPCYKGYSHKPEEFSSNEDIANGVKV